MSQNPGVWEETQKSAEFASLRKSFRGFAFPLTAAFLGWYFLYILLTAFARDFVSIKVIGNINVAFLVALAFAITASANLPAVLMSLFWKEFNTRGAVWAIYGGLIAAVGLFAFSPVVPGGATSLIPSDTGIIFNWFPLSNPGLVSIPFGFFMGWLGTKTSNERNYAKYAELEVRSLTGADIGKAVSH